MLFCKHHRKQDDKDFPHFMSELNVEFKAEHGEGVNSFSD